MSKAFTNTKGIATWAFSSLKNQRQPQVRRAKSSLFPLYGTKAEAKRIRLFAQQSQCFEKKKAEKWDAHSHL